MIKYTGYNITFKGLEHHLDLKSRLHLVYGRDSLSFLEVHIHEANEFQDESMEILYNRRLGGMLKPNAGVSPRESFTLVGRDFTRTFKINNLFV